LPKGIEAKGAFKIVIKLYNSPAGIFVRTYVMDNDSSTKLILKHPLQDWINNGGMRDADCPLTEAGVGVRDTGLLPINHPEIFFLVTRTIEYAPMLDTFSSWRKASVILVTSRSSSGPLATFCINSPKGLGNGFFDQQEPS
jgi:hypothetical protein